MPASRVVFLLLVVMVVVVVRADRVQEESDRDGSVVPGVFHASGDAFREPVPTASALSLSGNVDVHADAMAAPPLGAAVGVRSARELQRLIDRWPEDPDVFYTTILTLDLCDDPRLEKSVTLAIIAESKRRSGNVDGANYIEAATARLCDHRLSFPYPQAWSGLALTEHFETLVPELGLLKLEAVDLQEANDPERAKARHTQWLDEIAELMATTTSYFTYLELGALLIESNQFNALLRHIGHDEPLHDPYAGPVITLASCWIFGSCGADQFAAVHLCILHDCDGPTSLTHLVEQNTAPRHLPRVQRGARALVELRRGTIPLPRLLPNVH